MKETSEEIAKKKRWGPSGPSQGQGCGPPGWGGTIVRERPLLVLLTKEGGGQSFGLGFTFRFPSFTVFDNLAAERIREKVLLTFYIYTASSGRLAIGEHDDVLLDQPKMPNAFFHSKD